MINEDDIRSSCYDANKNARYSSADGNAGIVFALVAIAKAIAYAGTQIAKAISKK